MRSIPAYYDGQNANGAPDHFVSREEAQSLKARGRARSIHRGTAILIKGYRTEYRAQREKPSRGWIVLGQTPKNGPPGRPHWGVDWGRR